MELFTWYLMKWVGEMRSQTLRRKSTLRREGMRQARVPPISNHDMRSGCPLHMAMCSS